METYQSIYPLPTTMGIQQPAFIRRVRIRYSFPTELPSPGGKVDGSSGNAITAAKAITSQSEQNTHVNRTNSLLIRVHCIMTRSRVLRPLLQVEPENEPAREQRINTLPLRYQRSVGSANPMKEYYHAKSLPA